MIQKMMWVQLVDRRASGISLRITIVKWREVACGSSVRVCVYLSVKRLVDVHSVVLALLDEHVSTLPDESRGRVGVDGAAKEHCLFLVVAAAYITDCLVHCQNWRVEVCEGSKAERNNDLDVSWSGERTPSHPGTLLISALTHKKALLNVSWWWDGNVCPSECCQLLC